MLTFSIYLFYQFILLYCNSLEVSFDLNCKNQCTNYKINGGSQTSFVCGNSYFSYKTCTKNQIIVSYNNVIQIEIEANNDNVKVFGTVYIDGYEFDIGANVWEFRPGQWDQSWSWLGDFTYEANGNNKDRRNFKLKIPNDANALMNKNWETHHNQYDCDHKEFNLLNSNTVTFTLSDYITKKSIYTESIEYAKFETTPAHGSLSQYGVDMNLNNQFSATIPILYTPSPLFEYSYIEKLRYSAYKNSKVPQNCDSNVITLVVCGNKCTECTLQSNNVVKCEDCLQGYSFLKTEEQKCVVDHRDGYYLVPGTPPRLQECDSACKECSAGASGSKQNCLVCRDGLEYIQKFSDGTKNCYSSCYGLKVIEDSKECVQTCENTYKYKFGNNKCLYYFKGTHAYFLISDENECVTSCPFDLPYISGNNLECVEECTAESGYPFVSIAGQCVTNCEPGQVTLNEYKCAIQCSTDFPALVLDTNNCIVSCSCII